MRTKKIEKQTVTLTLKEYRDMVELLGFYNAKIKYLEEENRALKGEVALPEVE